MTETKVRHPGTGKAADVAEMVITDAEGRGKEVLALNLGSRPIYRKNWEVALALVGCTAETSGNAQWLQPWSCVIEPLAGHQQLPWNTKVTMGGVDITADVYDKATGQVSIPNVTGDITIEAEAVMMSSEYEPTKFGYKYSQQTGGALPLGWYANQATELILDIDCTKTSASLLVGYANCSVGIRPDDEVLWWNINSSLLSSVTSGDKGFAYLAAAKIPSGRFKGYVGQSVFKYEVDGETVYELNLGVISDYTAANPTVLFNRTNANNGSFQGYVYRVTHKEDGVVVNDYLPVRIKSSGLLGIYDVVTQTLVKSMAISNWMPGFVSVKRSYTGCAGALLSAPTTGSAVWAVIGSTWSIKITPSSGYTFVGGTTPQVLIDGIDVTLQVVTDNGDGTYNVTIANVEDKPIEITAVAVSDGTANATNSVTPMGGNTENNEEEM